MKITVTIREAADMTGVSEAVIRAAINTHALPAKRISLPHGRIIIKVTDLETWIDSLAPVA